MDLAEINARNQRLIILRALSQESDGRMNESLLARQLDLFGHALNREQVRVQLEWLAGVGAVRTQMVGPIMIVEITRRGEDHVERRGDPIEGIDRPSRV